MDDVVVRHRPTKGRSKVPGIALLVLGVLVLVGVGAAVLAGQHLPLTDEVGHVVAPALWGVLALGAVAAGIVLLATGGAKGPVAPNGVAWVLQRGGVLVPLEGRAARVPWHQVRFEPAHVAGKPGIRVVGPGVDRAYVAADLSHDLAAIDAQARRMAAG